MKKSPQISPENSGHSIDLPSSFTERLSEMPQSLRLLCFMVLMAAGIDLSGCHSFSMEYRDILTGCVTCRIDSEQAWQRINMMRTDERCPEKFKVALDYLAAITAAKMASHTLLKGCKQYRPTLLKKWQGCSPVTIKKAGMWYQNAHHFAQRAWKKRDEVDRSLMARNIGDAMTKGRGLLPHQRLYLKGILKLSKNWRSTVQFPIESKK